MRIQRVTSIGSGKINEDELLVKGNLFAVFDGVTSLNPFVDKYGVTGGKRAARATREIFSREQGSLESMARKANTRIREIMQCEGVNVSNKLALWGTTVAAVRLLSNQRAEYLGIGDSLVLLLMRSGSWRLVYPDVNHDLETLVAWQAFARKRTEDICNLIQPQLRRVRRFANITYGLLNGQRTALRFFRLGTFSLVNVASIILFTDGLQLPKQNPRQQEDWGKFVRLYASGGLPCVLKYVRATEYRDPKCWAYPRLKQHDDATAIGIDLVNNNLHRACS